MGFVDIEEWKKYRPTIRDKIKLVELIKEYGVKVFDYNDSLYKCYCPFHFGKEGGIERTPSLMIYQDTNSFFCFSCCKGGDAVDFVNYAEGVPKYIAAQKLAKKIGLIKKNGEWDELQATSIKETNVYKNIEPYVVEMNVKLGNYLRKFVNSKLFQQELKLVENVGKKIDFKLNKVGYEDWEEAEKMRNKVVDWIKNRKKKIGVQ